MKWFKKDLEQYKDAKEFVDTIIIPLQPFHFSDSKDLEKDAFNREILTIYTTELEKELSGRIMLTPTYTYLKTTLLDREVERLNEWIDNIKTEPFNYIFLLSLDMEWKKVEDNLDGNLIWLPGMKPANIQEKATIQLLHNQVEQISDLIRSYW